jgi:hypothetical protein
MPSIGNRRSFSLSVPTSVNSPPILSMALRLSVPHRAAPAPLSCPEAVWVLTKILSRNRPAVFMMRAHKKCDVGGRLVDEGTR